LGDKKWLDITKIILPFGRTNIIFANCT
jgi:hypothetical protein